MKTYYYMLVLGICILACKKSEDRTVSILHDITEPDFSVSPDPETIISLFGLDGDIWKGATFRYSRVTNLTYNSKKVISIPSQHAMFSNEIERRSLVQDFSKEITSLLQEPFYQNHYEYSSIWLPLVEELKTLQKDSVPAKIYLYSDLRENTNWYSGYRISDTKLLQASPDQVVKLFLSKATEIRPSHLVQVIVVYHPRTMEEDHFFMQFRSLYSKLFAELDVPIQFKSNLHFVYE